MYEKVKIYDPVGRIISTLFNHGGELNVINFSTSFSEPGTYRIFTQFQVKGKVITTDYTVRAQ